MTHTPVAPRAGAWIETGPFVSFVQVNLSRPARARGLKPVDLKSLVGQNASRPARARGLKLQLDVA